MGRPMALGHATFSIGGLVERVVSVYDGDTFRADITGYPAIVGSVERIATEFIETDKESADVFL